MENDAPRIASVGQGMPTASSPAPAPLLGLGRLEVTISAETYEAGQLILLPVIIRNSFDIPVEIIEVQEPRSSLLREKRKKELVDKTDEHNSEVGFLDSFMQKIVPAVSWSTSSLLGGVSFEFAPSNKTISIKAEKDSETTIHPVLRDFDTLSILAEEGARVTIGSPDEAYVAAQSPLQTVQPHCEAVAYFQVKTSGWLFFKPKRINMTSQLKYRVQGVEKTQVISGALDIHPPLRSMVIGSVVGAALGNLAQSLSTITAMTNFEDWEGLALKCGTAVIMSVIATVALSRKTGSQGFITVEDFFGGFVVGTLIGYGGVQYFEQAIAVPAEG